MNDTSDDKIHLFLVPPALRGAPVVATTATLGFGGALERLKAGKRVARAGWNGKGMWICLQRGYPDGIRINENTAEATGLPVGTPCIFRPYIMMRDAQGSFVPWLASQTDILATDWMEVA
jgi:hypothetical protein